MATKIFDFEFKRGDTKVVVFGITDKEGNALNLGSADEIYFTVKKNENEYILQKKISTQELVYNEGKLYVKFTHDDTNSLKAKSFSYDIQVNLNIDEFVDTPWEGEMTLLADVTRD